MVEQELPKLKTRVRFSSPAPNYQLGNPYMAKLKAVFHYAASAGIRKSLATAENDWLTIDICDEGDDDRLFRLIADADVLWHVLQPATAEVIAAAPKLRLIQKIGVGVRSEDVV